MAQRWPGDGMPLTVGAGCRCIHRVSIWLTLYTCDDSRAQYLACNSLILREQTENEIGHPFASSERNEASAQAQGVIRARDCVRRTLSVDFID